METAVLKTAAAMLCLMLAVSGFAVAQDSPEGEAKGETIKLIGPEGPPPAPVFEKLMDKVSYTIGMSMGNDFRQQKIDINLDVLLLGIRDAMAGREPRMAEQEMMEAMQTFQEELSARMQQEMMKLAEKNLVEGTAFLAENAAKPAVETLESGLQYEVLVEGSGDSPTEADSVLVHYFGKLLDGTEFDSSYKRGEPATFALSGDLIVGWKEAMLLMNTGAKWRIFIPAALGLGERGGMPTIPPNATLIFEVELIKINPVPSAPQAAPLVAPEAAPQAE